MSAVLVKGYTFGATEQVTATKLSNLVDDATISGIVAADITAGTITDTEISSVSGSKLTSLSGIPSGAGAIPAANITGKANSGANSDITSITGLTTALTTGQGGTGYTNDTRFKIGTLSRDMTASTADVAYTGLGFTPKMIEFFGGVNGIITTINGVSDGTNNYALYMKEGTVFITGSDRCISLSEVAAATEQKATAKTFVDGGFTLAWTKVGTPSTGTATIFYVAYR